MALQARDETGETPELISLDYIGKRAFDGLRMFLFGADSDFNPFRNLEDACAYLDARNSVYSWKILRDKHGTYFKEPNVVTLAKAIHDLTKRQPG